MGKGGRRGEWGRREGGENEGEEDISQQVAVGVASTLARTVKASGSRMKISLFSVATTRQLTASSSEWLFFMVSIATMTDCVCVYGWVWWGRSKDTIPHCDMDKRLREQRCVCGRCVEQHALVSILAQLYLSLQ